ncbi:hypothetical protein LTS18_010347 [Coniosporium uncinatum]|uniref:Uncharacterized protein n=1 Tax=Coniosporium uncinatum TaxID=93489 RepID=A0ACC3D9Y4_9PEZI|nr:hypothetical protein LTS18_010347 [Coniosporium uncinatum]
MANTNGVHHSIQSIVILWDTHTASSILTALKSSPKYTIHVLARSTPKPPLAAKNAAYHVSDFSTVSLSSHFETLKPDILISTSSGGAYDVSARIIDAAIAAGVPRFMPAEFGYDSLNEAVGERLPPSRERGRVIEYLREKSSSREDGGGGGDGRFGWCAVATGSELERGLLGGNLGVDLKWQSATLVGTGKEVFAASSDAWVGRVVKAVVERWEEVQGRYLYAAGMTVSAAEVVERLEKYGGKKFEVGYVEVEDVKREAERRMDRGFPDAGMWLTERTVWCEEGVDAVRPYVEEDAKKTLGLEGESLDEIVREVLHKQKHHGGRGCGCD